MSKLNQTNLLSFFAAKSSNNGKSANNATKTEKINNVVNGDDDDDETEVKTPKRKRLQILDSDDEEESGKSVNTSSKKVAVGRESESPEIKTTPRKRKLDDKTPSNSNGKYAAKRATTKQTSFDVTPKVPKAKKTGKNSYSPTEMRSNGVTSTPIARKSVEAWSFNESPSSSVGITEKSRSYLSSFCADDSINTSQHIDIDSTVCNFKHLSFEFLQPDQIRDENKVPPSDSNYDGKTLFVPESFLKTQTPGLKQWWEIKRKHFDTLLLFKVGKFYELYHMDAVIAVKELNLSFMKGDFAHCGFPEIAYSRFSDQLVERGYKVARVEQTETPEMLEERQKNTPRSQAKEKVVRREVCRITTPGTKTYGFLDGDTDCAQGRYLYAICEESLSSLKSSMGVCFVDTAVGKIFVSQFEDESHFSNLRTVFAEYSPVQILFPRGKLSSRLETLLKTHYTVVIKESLTPKSQFWTTESTLKHLAAGSYFKNDNNDPMSLTSVAVLKELLNANDTLGLTADVKYKLALSSFGAIIWYLQECLIDVDVLSLKNFALYTPKKATVIFDDKTNQKNEINMSTMILDGVTLKNLEILQNLNNSSAEGTLLERMDQCCTNFGKRLLRHWLCNPSCVISTIECRQKAVIDLLKMDNFVIDATKLMKQMPDLERLLQKIHTLGSKHRRDDHPDSRAVLYNMDVYNKRKVNDLLTALEGFKKAVKIVDEFRSYENLCSSSLLNVILRYDDDGGRFPRLNDALDYFDKSFDREKAKKEGVILPTGKGIDENYDSALVGIKEAENCLQNYLSKLRSRYNCATITYLTSGRNRYVLEVPDNIATKLSEEFEFESQRKGFKRYSTNELIKLRENLEKFETEKGVALKDVMRRVFANFGDRNELWRRAIECLSIFDVLMSFVKYVKSCGAEYYCQPEIVPCSTTVKPFIKIECGVHPCLSKISTCAASFVPNDTVIGCNQNNNSAANVLLITGPNMGGKSTLMRQVSLIVIMAQIGSLVPAKSCSLTLVDRIFTRLGANDRIAAGQSTFFVELSETSAILKHATMHSLVILDELGRGTATHDGTAIASAVLKDLADNIQCRTLFSTHYHTLVDEYCHNSRVSMNHMACVVENENNDDPTEETITFLYKLTTGSCPKSYGFHAAKLAGLPLPVIRRAWECSKMMENGAFSIDKLRSLAFGGVDSISDEVFLEKLVDAMKL